MRDWKRDVNRLADELIAAGKLHSPAWVEAFTQVPRHAFVPRFWIQESEGWRQVDAGTDEGWEAIYSNKGLFTALDENGLGISSSSMPGLMTRMLETLDVQPGHRVLEVGTGTGYNAALLSAYLGDSNVYSVDIEFVEAAANRLASLGMQPTLDTRDGRVGFAEAAPFDRIMATCAVSTIPSEWISQLAPGGMILADLKVNRSAGNLVLLRRTGSETAEGRFVPGWAEFMSMRTEDTTAPTAWSGRDAGEPQHTTTRITGRPWRKTVPWFMASFELPAGVQVGLRLREGCTWWTITTPDGSRAEVCETGTGNQRDVIQSGPRRLWDSIETAFAEWENAGSPDWSRFGLTVESGAHTVWLDDPTSPHSWKLAIA